MNMSEQEEKENNIINNIDDKTPSGKELRQQQRPKSTEELQLESAITNANVVDINARTSTSTGGENPNVEKRILQTAFENHRYL